MATKYQQRHYEDLAEIVRVLRTSAKIGTVDTPADLINELTAELAHLFGRDNSRFDVARFVKATKGQDWTEHNRQATPYPWNRDFTPADG